MKKHLAYYENEWPADIVELTAVENKPFVGVCGKEVQYTVIPEPEQPSLYEAVDLGLPSGLKWATQNVTQNMYESWTYQWGVPYANLDSYEQSTYPLFNSETGQMVKYNTSDLLTTLAKEDDVASVVWGGNWRTPTSEDWNELKQYCTWTWEENGYRITSNNPEYSNNSIFLYANGIVQYGSASYGDIGTYWSSSLNKQDINKAGILYFTKNIIKCDYPYERWYGCAIRPVCI